MKFVQKNYKYIILSLTCLCGLSACYCQYQMSPMASQIMELYHMTQVQFSSVFSASMVPAIFLSVIGGMVVDRLGAKRIIFIGLVIAALGLVARVFVESYTALFICMLLSGIPATFLNAVNAKILGEWFPARQASIAMGIYLSCTAMGMALGTGTTAVLMSLKIAFAVAAVLAIVAAALWGMFMRERPITHGVAEKEVESVEKKEDYSTSKSVYAVFRVVIRNKDILLGSLGIMCMYGNYMVISTYLPTGLQEKGLSAIQAGTIASMVSFGYFAGCVCVPILADKIGRIKPVMFVLALGGTALPLLISSITSETILVIVLLVLGFCIGGILPLFMSFPVRIQKIGKERAGTAGGIISTFQLLGAVVIPSYVVVPVAGGDISRMFLIGAGFGAVTCVMVAFLTKAIEVQTEKRYNVPKGV